MSILIKGMEMPTSCYVCPFCDYVSARCDAVKGNPYTPESRYEKRADFCPLVPVPPHGDLIDRQDISCSLPAPIEDEYKQARKAVMAATTIIPAEEGET